MWFNNSQRKVSGHLIKNFRKAMPNILFELNSLPHDHLKTNDTPT